MGTFFSELDQSWADHVASEIACLSGTEAIIFQFDQSESIIDPIWNETVSRDYKNNTDGVMGIKCPVTLKSPDRSPSSGDQGHQIEKNGTVSVARVDLDNRNLNVPKIGDIWMMWGRYYDVTKASGGEGRVFDNGVVTDYMVSVVRRTKAVPERLWFDDTPQPSDDAQD